MLSHKESDRGRHYVNLLDDARCNSQWEQIPELTRKVAKHVPQHQCLVTTAQAERLLAQHQSSLATDQSLKESLGPLIPKVSGAIERESTFQEDRLQAKICLGLLYSSLNDKASALKHLPGTVHKVLEEGSKLPGGIKTRWTHVCLIRGVYTWGFIQDTEGNLREALQSLGLIMSYLSDLSPAITNTVEHRFWTECLLSHYCRLISQHVATLAEIPSDLKSWILLLQPISILAPFHEYAKRWDAKPGASGGSTIKSGLNWSRIAKRTWQGYYDLLSVLMLNGILQPIFQSRLQQSQELKRVEAILERIILNDINFPRADQTSSQIEMWADQVMANWRIMCDLSWREEDLGEGGKRALGHGVLEILYRAASKSFHSTRVLRHLFTVHGALAEFYLARKALDSYLEILTKGKARIEKSGEIEPGLDDDATALATVAAGIKMLCGSGRRSDAERAQAIATTTDQWLQKLHRSSSRQPAVSAEDVPRDLVQHSPTAKPLLPGRAIALGYHALGASQYCWANLTYETSSRSTLQTSAITNYRSALDPELKEENNVEILYSLAFALAETQEIDAAIATVKRALSSASEEPTTMGTAGGGYSSENVEDDPSLDAPNRGLVLKCWLLLALLLSARDDFSNAIASCEAALDLYGNKSILYGDAQPLDSVTDLGLAEKKNIIEIKITQLALMQIIDGPEEAVNASGELLGLYTTLFKYTETSSATNDSLERVSPPTSKNGTGTPKSFRESILSLSKDTGLKSRLTSVRSDRGMSSLQRSLEVSNETSTAPPMSGIEEQDHAAQSDGNHSHLLGRHESKKLQKRNSRKTMHSHKGGRAASPSRASTADHSTQEDQNLALPIRAGRNDAHTNGSVAATYPESTQYASDEVGVAISHDLPSMPSTPAATSDPPNFLHHIHSTAQNMNRRNPNTDPVPPKPPLSQTTRHQPTSPFNLASLPEPQYPPHEELQHRLTVLIKIWLVISSLYRQASMPVDAQGALSEATKHVQTIERSIATHNGSSAQSFSTPGYGGLKASNEIWADVLAEQAALHITTGDVEKASSTYETALGYWPDHVDAIVGLCNILLDTYSTPPEPTTLHPPPPIERPISTPTLGTLPSASTLLPFRPSETTVSTPELLSRLSARDRAYGLLSALTKSGRGWNCSEAWYALGRAYELSGQVEKAKEALWWVVELEEGRGVRPWRCIV